ncbi:MAG: hypothetical protein IRZ32_18580 [Solirubrobacteraceae bacterium]|nr:hypothetical protein [Solirubrobacteraceae bacterium]
MEYGEDLFDDPELAAIEDELDGLDDYDEAGSDDAEHDIDEDVAIDELGDE